MSVTCPECRATLEPDEIDHDRLECPICMASLAHLDLPQIEQPYAPRGGETIRGRPGEELDIPSPSSTKRQYEIIERSADRLVAHLPPNTAGAGGLGAFVLVWNSLLAVISTFALFVFRKQRPPTELIPFLIGSVFWAIGIGLFFFWLKMRFTRLYLLLEKDRLVIQRKFLRTTNRELLLSPSSKATLEQSYAVNDVPVHSITVNGMEHSESFGTGLSPEDKENLVRELNSFLGVKESYASAGIDDRVCSCCGAPMMPSSTESTGSALLCEQCQEQASESPTASPWQPLRGSDTTELPEALEFDDTVPDRMELRYPLFMQTPFTRAFPAVLLVFATIWTASILFVLPQRGGFNAVGVERVFVTVFTLFMLLPGLFIIGLAQAIRAGRIVIQLTPNLVKMTWGWGLFSIRKQFAPESITACRILQNRISTVTANHPKRAASRPITWAAIQTGATVYPLVTTHGREYGYKVVRLVRTAIEDLTGRHIPD